MRDDRVYIRHMMECIAKVEDYTGAGYGVFMRDSMVQDAVIRNLEILGEAAKQVSSATRNRYEAIPWRRIAGMRDVLIHDYMGVDLDEVWNVVANELGSLKDQLLQILKETNE